MSLPDIPAVAVLVGYSVLGGLLVLLPNYQDYALRVFSSRKKLLFFTILFGALWWFVVVLDYGSVIERELGGFLDAQPPSAGLGALLVGLVGTILVGATTFILGAVIFLLGPLAFAASVLAVLFLLPGAVFLLYHYLAVLFVPHPADVALSQMREKKTAWHIREFVESLYDERRDGPPEKHSVWKSRHAKRRIDALRERIKAENELLREIKKRVTKDSETK